MEEKNLKLFGTGIIVIGLLMLVFTFFEAYDYLKSPYPVLKTPETSGTNASGTDLGSMPDIDKAMNKAITQTFLPFFNSMIPLIYSSGYLTIMGLIGFWIMGRGILLVRAPK